MAGGNIINDIYDRVADRINKPGKNLIGTAIKEKHARILYWALSVSGMLLGYFMGYTVGITILGSVHLIAFFLLWMYSTDFKYRALLGNVVVALLSSLVIVTIVLFDVVPANQDAIRLGQYNNLLLIFLAYAIFAFVTTLIREIIKDVQDVKGDKRAGGRTIAVRLSQTTVKAVVVTFQIALALSLLFLVYYFRQTLGIVIYVSVLVFAPVILSTVAVIRSKSPENWGLAAKLMKLVMVFGILSVIIFTYA